VIAKAIVAAAVMLAALGAVTAAATSSRVPERERIEPVAVSANGSRAFFVTKQRLIRSDRDQAGDLYEWRRGRLILLSAPSAGQPTGDANIAGGKVSSDGRFAYFVTGDPLVLADDDDGREDVYLAAFGSLRLVSGPTDCAQTIPCDGPAYLSGTSADGSHAFFESFERLAPEDMDNRPDLYDFDRRSGRLSLVSYGPAGGNASDAGFSRYAGSSADGRHVYFTTPETLVPEDTDGSGGADLYRRSGGQTSLVSTGPGGSGPGFVSAIAVSGDGTRAVFFTRDPLLPADDDGGSNDIYLRAGGTTILVSDGAGPDDSGRLGRVEVSEDARRIFFETSQRLGSRDRDREVDVYRWRLGGSTELTPTASGRGNAPFGTRLEGISANGRHAFLATGEPMVRRDRDRQRDLYRWRRTLSEVIRRADPRRLDVPRFLEASFDGARVAFATRLAISRADRDRSLDFYVLRRGRYFLVSTGPGATSRSFAPGYAGSSRNGARVFFKTEERLLRADRDRIQDLYGRWSGRTRLVSR
jgi:hypothetical protein